MLPPQSCRDSMTTSKRMRVTRPVAAGKRGMLYGTAELGYWSLFGLRYRIHDTRIAKLYSLPESMTNRLARLYFLSNASSSFSVQSQS